LLLLGSHVLLLRADEGPDFIALQATNPHIADVAMMIGGTGAANIAEQIQNGMLGNASHADDCIDRDTLD
jgi:hypothetical protein